MQVDNIFCYFKGEMNYLQLYKKRKYFYVTSIKYHKKKGFSWVTFYEKLRITVMVFMQQDVQYLYTAG